MKFYVGTEEDPEDRTILELSEEDHAKCCAEVRGGHWQATVTDISTGKVYTVADEDCGFGCRCASRFVDAVLTTTGQP